MRFDVSSTALLSRLQSISKVIASKNSLPILDSFLFNLEGNKLTITASDAETRLVTSVDVMNAQGSGRCLGKNPARSIEGVARTTADF